MNVLIELHYIPSLEYFSAVLPAGDLVLETHECFVKQTYRNRCYLNTANGVKVITVPLVARHGKMLTKDIRIGTGKQWRTSHWRTIESAYRKAPFFDYYSDELKNILFSDHEYLIDLNTDLLSFCLRQFRLQKNISASLSYQKEVGENTLDLRSTISDKKPFSFRNYYHPHPYHQVFGNEFAPNLSFIDLLFCEGPEALALIRSSSQQVNK